ncbi:OLC1v1020645C1 [Oldenlandia corymbosa var. corymbosa]|uniref:OLC1v1020645C1 n=1 Tax=Oldenlandia corymbosa var. corymbosa TaxID=529605 RepID=A0AAV1EH71_OLDCO|nr:OLC1v1020645C1 [Oldenlandia corymbosa var. corymbosa]
MGTTNNIRDLLTSFSPSLDFFAISSGDGRIKIWDTVKGQLQTEFSDIVSSDATNELFGKSERGHLSVDYKCMTWLSLEKKKKRKLGTSLLVLGTGSGDVLALDVAAGQLKWKVNDCHPGGVNAISFCSHGSFIYTAGVDGRVCRLDSLTGNLLDEFKASTKAISSLVVSADGKMLSTAAAQLKIFDCFKQKKMQKFSGHPGTVSCMVFSEDGRYVLSSAVGERYVAIWRIDGSKNKSACCSLPMDHPPVFLDCKCVPSSSGDDASLCILAISEVGVCYYWHGSDIQEINNSKHTKIYLNFDEHLRKKTKGTLPGIFAAKLQNVSKPSSVQVLLAYGLLMKPSFENILVQPGHDLKLSSSLDGILLPISQLQKSKKVADIHSEITALDRASAEDALLPKPKFLNVVDKTTSLRPTVSREDMKEVSLPDATFSMEDRLRSVGILDDFDGLTSGSVSDSAETLQDINLVESVSQKKMKANILSLEPSEAYKLLKILVAAWFSRSFPGRYVLPWICCILVNHSQFILDQEPGGQLLDSLFKLSKSREGSVQYLLQLSGRLQLVTAQVGSAGVCWIENFSYSS